MIKVKDGYAKLIGTTASGSASRVLLSNGGDHVLGNASGNIPLNNGTVNTNLNADMLDGLHIHTGRNNEVNKVVRTDASGYILAGWINTTSGDMGTTAATRIYCSNDGYIRYKTPANFFETLTNDGNQISITVGSQNRKLTVNYASFTKMLDNVGLPSSTSNAANTAWCKFARITFNNAAWSTASGYLFFGGGENPDNRGILVYHFRASSTATTLSTANLHWLVKSYNNATVIAVKVEDNVYDLYTNNSGTYMCPRIYHMSAFSGRFAWSVGSWTTTKPTAAYTSSDIGRVYYAENANSATQVIVNLHTSNNTEYPLVWSNSASTSTTTGNLLYKSYSHLTYNPSAHRISTGQYIANNSSGPHFTANSATGSWAYLRLNNGSTYWDIATRSDSASGGLWLARLSGADNGIFVSTGNSVGISTSSPADKLHVNGGQIRSTHSSRYLRIGPQNSSHAHYETDADISHWFNKRVEVNGHVNPYNNNSFTSGTSDKRWANVYSVLGNFTGNVTLYSASGDSPHLYFLRGTTSDGTYDWDMFVTGGSFTLRQNNAGTWNTALTAADNYMSTGWRFNVGKELSVRDQRFNYGLAYYNTSTSTVTGTIVITLPNGWTNAMNTYEIDIYEYIGYSETSDNVLHSKLIIDGYNYSGSSAWINYGYTQIGSYNKGVRLGYNGSKCVIMLGTTSTTWTYPQVHLSRVITGYGNQTAWSTGYSISVITSESGYSAIVTANRLRQRFADVVANTFRGTLSGRATSVGDGTMIMYPQNNNEVNFGGSNNSGTLYFGYRAADSRPIPSNFIFGGSGGTATLTATKLHSTGILYLNGVSGVYLQYNGADASSLVLTNTYFKPFDAANNKLTLGSSSARWSNVYSYLGNFKDTVYIYADSSGNYTEGIRLYGTAKDSTWSNIQFGCDPAATNGTHANLWLLGRDNNNRFVLRNNTTDRLYVLSDGKVGINVVPTLMLHVNGNAMATNLGVNALGGGNGISLYNGVGNVGTYGIAFNQTANWGTHGYVTGDWATYFTMSNTENRGWVFRRSGSGNVFSIDCDGHAYTNGLVNANYFNSRVATGTQPYACTSTTLNTNLNADLLDGVHASGLFTSLANSGNNISITIGGTTKTLTPAYATSAGNADTLDSYHRKGLYSSIPAWINANEYTRTITVGGSADTYYPVVITTPTDKEFPGYISVWKNLGSTTASYSGNHSNGTSSMWLLYEVRNWYWDGNGGYLKCWYYSMPYASLCAKAEAAGSGVGALVVYLRGGGTQYKVSSTYGASATVYTASTNIGSSSSPVNVAPTTSIGNRGLLSNTYLGYGNISGSSGSVRDAGNGNAITLKYSSGGFTSNPSYLAAWNGYQITYVAPSYVTVGGATLASTVTVSNSDSNSTYRMVWHSGNSLYSTAGIYCNPSSDYLYSTSMVASSWFRSTGKTGWYSADYGGGIYMEDSTWVRTYNSKSFYCSAVIQAGGRIYTGYDSGAANSVSCSNWFRSNGNTGWYNPTNECHVYPNAVSTYGGLILRGTKGGYHGFLLGTSTSYMNVMDDGTNKGLYQEGNMWILYYNKSNNGVAVRTSTITKNFNVNGQSYLSSNTWIGTTSGGEMLNVGGWVGTVGNTGWYSVTHTGGWYMEDSTYIRVYNSKRVYNSNTSQYAFYTAGGMTAEGHMYATTTGSSWLDGQRYNNAAFNITNSPSSSSYSPWMRQTLNAGRWVSMGTLSNSLYFIGSVTSRTENSYDYGFRMDFSNGYLYGNFSGYLSGTASNATLASTVTVSNSDSNSTYRMVWHSGNSLYSTSAIYCNPSSDYLYASSFYCGNWFRSSGATGWYSESYGGGWYMTESTYVRTYNSKAIYIPNTGDHAIYTAGGFASARTSGSILATYYNSTWYTGTIYNHGNGNLSINPPGGSLFLSYDRGNTYFGGSTYYIDRAGYFNGTCAVANKLGTSNKGSATQGIYLSGGTPYAMTYSLGATVNAGTASKLAYYSGANAISAYTSNCGSYYEPIYLSGGVPIACYARSIGSVTFGTNCSGYIYVYLFGPIIILEGYISKIQLSNTSSTNYVFKLPSGTKSPYTTCGFSLVLKDGYANDRNTVIILSGQYGYCSTSYNDYNPDGAYYYFSACYI